TAEFIAPLNRWQHGTNEFINPSYYRVDVDVSARVRWFMILLKWENVLDQVQQLGYFESVGYPMPGRRFRFGVRVLFTN
ncbi:MAG: TonB-dependent receptor, partial [Bacteroidetes bacterium]|nr:TonB-dependent receptor [Bacteroidota bacterium]